jgi:hypothetical protein
MGKGISLVAFRRDTSDGVHLYSTRELVDALAKAVRRAPKEGGMREGIRQLLLTFLSIILALVASCHSRVMVRGGGGTTADGANERINVSTSPCGGLPCFLSGFVRCRAGMVGSE